MVHCRAFAEDASASTLKGGSGWGPVTMMRVLVQIRSLKIIQFSSNVDWGGRDGQISEVQRKNRESLTIML
jgi:hypothetical protein